jgi:hypothetical protein
MSNNNNGKGHNAVAERSEAYMDMVSDVLGKLAFVEKNS